MKDCKWKDCNEKVNDLHKHLLEHISTVKEMKCKWIDCKFYDYKLLNKSDLNNHIRLHTGELTLLCNVCGRGFIKEDLMKQHLIKHKIDTETNANISNELFSLCENRECELIELEEAFKERQYQMNLIRVLKDEFIRDKSKDTKF
ncbi:Z6B5 [Hepatospora eriocheir]|uniref:Z6B5 n=1 Tax=Hepatospora eriocheir TaxID=1081669 RepID=A0A1X0QJG9_9MICR|nr:Z6B5 [Hepatospora eriocheir]ORD99920.1 Z6B5 [Hepatospora eriocheir]